MSKRVWFRVVLQDLKADECYSVCSAEVEVGTIVEDFLGQVASKTGIPRATINVCKSVGGGVKLFEDDGAIEDILKDDCGTTMENAVLVRRRPKTGEESGAVTSALVAAQGSQRQFKEQLAALNSKMEAIDFRSRSAGRGTVEWAKIIDECPQDQEEKERICCYLANCDTNLVNAAWNDLVKERRKLSTAKYEAQVQEAVIAAGRRCCQGGKLAIHDTHKKNYPGNHKIGICYLPYEYSEREFRVLFAELASFAELKYDLADPKETECACIQLYDRFTAIQEAQGDQRYILAYIADKATIRFFLCCRDLSPGPFISTFRLPFLNEQEQASEGFQIFFRFHQSTAEQLGYISPQIRPGIRDPHRILRCSYPPKACIYLVERGAEDKLIAKAYDTSHRISQYAIRSELAAIKRFNDANAPVIVLHEDMSAVGVLLLKPFGRTLRECVDFDVELLCKVASSAGGFLRIAKSLGLVHRDISPENIIVGPNDDVVISDLGSSCSATASLCSFQGVNPVTCCPVFGQQVERGRYAAYTIMNDLRCVFITLLSHALAPRKREGAVLPGLLPWERELHKMQIVKCHQLHSRSWTENAIPEALPFLRILWIAIFVDKKIADDCFDAEFNVEAVLDILCNLKAKVTGKDESKT